MTWAIQPVETGVWYALWFSEASFLMLEGKKAESEMVFFVGNQPLDYFCSLFIFPSSL